MSNRFRSHLIGIVVAMAGLLTYNAIDMQLFSFGLLRKTKEKLFSLMKEPEETPPIMLLNTGKLTPEEIVLRVDSLLAFRPKRVGINLCDFKGFEEEFRHHYANHPKVVLAECVPGSAGSLSAIVDDRNRVTHFRTDRPDYFEASLAGSSGRGEDSERLFYAYGRHEMYRGELGWQTLTDYPSGFGMVVLVGYMGDVLTDSLYYFKSTRVTPLNSQYDHDEILPDMYDLEISAQIVAALQENRFIDDVPVFARVAILALFCAFNFFILIYLPTKRFWLNVLIAFFLFLSLMVAGFLLMIYLFQQSIFLSLDELPLMLALLSGSILLQQVMANRREEPPIKPNDSDGGSRYSLV